MVQPNQYPGILKDIIGCLELVDDLKSLVYQCEYNLISVKDASSILQHGTSKSRDVGTNVDIDEENLHLSTLATKEIVAQCRSLGKIYHGMMMMSSWCNYQYHHGIEWQ